MNYLLSKKLFFVFLCLSTIVLSCFNQQAYAYTAPSITTPLAGTALNGTTVDFSWAPNTASRYWLYIGNDRGGHDIYNSGSLGTSTSVTVNNLPYDGRTIFVRLWFWYGSWNYTDYTYTAYSEGSGLTDDHGDDCTSATLLKLNSNIDGSINPQGDYDVFEVHINESGTLTISTTGNTDTFGYLLNSDCSLIISDDDSGQEYNFSIAREVDTGTYYIAVRHYSSKAIGNYVVHTKLIPNGGNDDGGNDLSAFEAELLQMINDYRAANNLQHLQHDSQLHDLAMQHSIYMYNQNRLSHDGFSTRCAQANGTACAENVGWNYPTAQSQFYGWKNSSGHNQNMLYPPVNKVGIAKYGPFVTFFVVRR